MGKDKVHFEEHVSFTVVESFETVLELECYSFVRVKHFKHEFFDFFNTYYLKCLIKEFDEVARGACEHLLVAVDLNFDVRIGLLLEDVSGHCD